jgi:hypothetical protein
MRDRGILTSKGINLLFSKKLRVQLNKILHHWAQHGSDEYILKMDSNRKRKTSYKIEVTKTESITIFFRKQVTA